MKLHSFSVQNFRSITQANKIPFEDITILLGKNNEGKSNMLRALKICMNILNNEFTPHYIDSEIEEIIFRIIGTEIFLFPCKAKQGI